MTKIIELYKQFSDKDSGVTPVTHLKDIYPKLKPCDEKFCLFVHIEPYDRLLKQAQASEQRYRDGKPLSKLDGMLCTVKDVFRVKDFPLTRFGSAATSTKLDKTQLHLSEREKYQYKKDVDTSEDQMKKDHDIVTDTEKEEDAPPVERLREAGVIFIAKTTTPEFGHKATCDYRYIDENDSVKVRVTTNPWSSKDKPLTCGGSSGGAAVAALLGLGEVHLGSDGAGSVRIPASFCGIVGFKPTHSLIAHTISHFMGISHSGILSRYSEDIAEIMNIVAVQDDRDYYSYRHIDHPHNFGSVGDNIKNSRIGYSLTLGGLVDKVHPEVEQIFCDSLKYFEKAGCTLTKADPQWNVRQLYDSFRTIWLSGVANTARAHRFDENEHAFSKTDPHFQRMVLCGEKYLATDIVKSVVDRYQVAAHMQHYLREHDYFICPTMPIPAFEAGVDIPKNHDYVSPPWVQDHADKTYWFTWSPYTYPFNLTKQPAISIPIGFTKDNRPVGLMIVGRAFDDEGVLRVARALERETERKFFKVPNE